jgi:ferredoxin-thioredoxin reductase catalytic subunit
MAAQESKISLSKDDHWVGIIREKLKSNSGYCPCKAVKNDDTKCPCKEFRELKSGNCSCGLFTKEIISED